MFIRYPRAAALATGLLCHGLFLCAIAASFLAMYRGMQVSLVHLPRPFAYLWDGLLLLQFPVLHSFLLSKPGGKLLVRSGPSGVGRDLVTTTFTIIASLQMLLLYLLWSPLGPVWWSAQGMTLVLMTGLYLAAWLLLGRAMYDAGLAIQTGFLGWSSVFRKRRPNYGGMPEGGMFRVCRQPIYLAFALTMWTVPVWTPDQLMVALWFSSYCLLGPLFKERRYKARYGETFERYRRKTPYFLPKLL